MFRTHILLKLVQRSNPVELGNLLQLDKKTSKEVAWLLEGAQFPKVELSNDILEIKYKLTRKNGSIKLYAEFLERELATNAYKLRINSEDILQMQVLEPNQVTNIFPFNINERAKYFKVTFRREIINFIILLIECLRSKDRFRIKTYYTSSEVYFEFLHWYKLEDVKPEKFLIWWGYYWGGGRGGGEVVGGSGGGRWGGRG